MEVTQYVYALRDPFTGERRYVGKSKDPRERYRKHILPYYLQANTYKNRWLRKVLAAGGRPILEILCESAPWEDINQIERDFIRWLRRSNRLTNGTPGGDGGATVKSKKMPPRGPSPMRGIRWSADDPRREQIRRRQLGVVPVHALRRALEKNTLTWVLVSPSGQRFEVRGLGPFAAEHGLLASKLAEVARGKRPHHKGWRCAKL